MCFVVVACAHLRYNSTEENESTHRNRSYANNEINANIMKGKWHVFGTLKSGEKLCDVRRRHTSVCRVGCVCERLNTFAIVCVQKMSANVCVHRD